MFSSHRREHHNHQPTDSANIIAWWDFDDTSRLTLSSGDITAVVDKSGNGRDLSSAAGKYPSLVTGVINGRQVARFDGVDEYMHNTLGTTIDISATGATVYIAGVKRSADGAADQILIGGEDATHRFLWYPEATPAIRQFRGGTSQTITDQFTQNTSFVTALRQKNVAEDWAVQTNDTYQLNVTASGSQDITGITVCSTYDLSLFGQFDLSEVILFAEDTMVTATHDTTMRNYFLQKYNIDIGPQGGS
jgi:hypothetical protein